jgi:TatA/E family protein of Tat protein translocase
MPLPPALFDGIGFSEMLVIAFIAILVFGGRLPDALRNVGRGYAKFRKGIHDVSRPLRDEIQRATTLPPETFTPALPRPAAPPPAAPGAPSAPYDVAVPAHPSGDLTNAGPPPSPAPAAPISRPSAFDDEPPPV